MPEKPKPSEEKLAEMLCTLGPWRYNGGGPEVCAFCEVDEDTAHTDACPWREFEKYVEQNRPRKSPGTMKRRVVTVPRVKKARLLEAFEGMCLALGKTSRGFDVAAIKGKGEWAMRYCEKCGWMVVCGLGGCGVALGRWNAYMQTRWNFMMMMEAVTETARHP